MINEFDEESSPFRIAIISIMEVLKENENHFKQNRYQLLWLMKKYDEINLSGQYHSNPSRPLNN